MGTFALKTAETVGITMFLAIPTHFRVILLKYTQTVEITRFGGVLPQFEKVGAFLCAGERNRLFQSFSRLVLDITPIVVIK